MNTMEHIAHTFDLDSMHRALDGEPVGMEEQFLSDIKMLVSSQSDTGEKAYYDTRKLVFDWLDKEGVKRSYGEPVKKGNALYYYRQALKYRDLKAAERYLQKYFDLGGERRDLKDAVHPVHPLASVPKMKRFEFRRSLSPAEEKKVTRGINWYQRGFNGPNT
jgi:hypothetical protein